MSNISRVLRRAAGIAVLPLTMSGPVAMAADLPASPCWLELGTGHSHGVMQAYAAPRLAGSYELSVRQDGGAGELLVDQAGSFTPYNYWPTSLSRIVVGNANLRPAQVHRMRALASQPGTTVIATSTRPDALPASAYGFRADLTVYDTAGRRICQTSRAWR